MTDRELRSRLERRAKRAGVSLDSGRAFRLAQYLDLLFLWNRKINLTSLTDPDEAIDRLVIEPLLAARFLPAPASSLMDIGSGGGSPAIPLKLAAPWLALVMVEAKVRKAAFLREVARQLELSDARVETGRFEELLARPEFHEAMDVLSLRAVRVEERTLMGLQAFLRPGGRVLLFRGPSGPDALAVTPPLVWEATQPLVEVLRSRLTILSKTQVGSKR